jgi:GNAT superfamily N-acetyltransferase
VGAVRRASAADAEGIARLFPSFPSLGSMNDTRASFVIGDQAAPLGVVLLEQAADHLAVRLLEVAPDGNGRDVARTLIAFAEMTARAIGLRQVRLAPGLVPADFAASLGYRDGVKRIRTGKLARMIDHLEAVGVPLWRDGAAPFDLTLYYRGVWAAMALLVGFGSISLAVFGPGNVTLLHVLGPALLCVGTSLFAIVQVSLIVVAARRRARPLAALGTFLAAALSIAGVGGLFLDRAVPSIGELWAIYTGDEALDTLTVSVSPDGATLYVDGAYGTRSADAVRTALDKHPSIRRVVLAGPGGRIGAAFEINRMIRNRKLATRVDTGCASACTIAFLGGTDRSISPSGRLGFHQGSFPGMSANDMYESNRDMRRFLVASGVTPEFAQRVTDTPHDEIWTPTPQELLAGRVVQRVIR